jgi:2-phosphoglycerate kinase
MIRFLSVHEKLVYQRAEVFSGKHIFPMRVVNCNLHAHVLCTRAVDVIHKKEANKQSLHMLILGCPGSGKGTLAHWLKRDFGIERLTTGDLLRKQVMDHTNIGQLVKASMDQGSKL